MAKRKQDEIPAEWFFAPEFRDLPDLESGEVVQQAVLQTIYLPVESLGAFVKGSYGDAFRRPMDAFIAVCASAKKKSPSVLTWSLQNSVEGPCIVLKSLPSDSRTDAFVESLQKEKWPIMEIGDDYVTPEAWVEHHVPIAGWDGRAGFPIAAVPGKVPELWLPPLTIPPERRTIPAFVALPHGTVFRVWKA